MALTDLFFTGGDPPHSAAQWVVLCVTALFTIFITTFIALLGLSLLFAIVSLFEQMFTWTI